MGFDVIEVIRPGMGATVQDMGRPGWARFGLPPGGAMDRHAAAWANRLVGNDENTPLIELLMQGARLKVLHTVWMAITGADTHASLPTWRLVRAHAGETIAFPLCQAGLWSYVAVEGGFEAETLFGSASTYSRGRLGRRLREGDILFRADMRPKSLPDGVAGRHMAENHLRDYNHPEPLRVWRGPQWNEFSPAARERLFEEEWTVSPESDRVGYRLQGPPLPVETLRAILSEPTLVGSVQVPGNGLPIVTMRDGPTVGGYPKIALLDADEVSRFAQCRPGTRVRFAPA